MRAFFLDRDCAESAYAAESYEIITQNSYILRMNRIAGSKKSPPSANKTSVLLLHGLPDASPTWVAAGPENALTDAGYDVDNSRCFFFGPVAFMSQVKNILFQLVATFVGDNSLTKSLGQSVCISYLELLFSRDENLNTTLLPLIAQYHLAGAALKQLAHFGQNVRSGTFWKFDHGIINNIKKYGQIHPDCNLRNITLPVYLIYTAIDELADVQDLRKLYEILPNAQKFLIPCDNFAHLDFVWGKYANTLVHNRILSLMERYRK
ncbi:Lipase 3 [Melipona quadrifasciata]|uniref:Lipase 3 n=1 Tax=Melipona quadrifasciata TaxID=166423 RepID=A0A0N0BBI8_9HYME|nr:Lipase 3 [Melipona quadrifasciata]